MPESTTLTLATGRVVTLSARVIERFLSLVDEPDEKGCRHWTGRVDRDGYGVFPCYDSARPGKVLLLAHRLGFRLNEGRSAAPGMDVDHHCFDRLCMAHLVELSLSENRGRRRARADADLRCVNGHDRAGNTRVDPRTGYRSCILCTAAAGRRHRARQQAA